MIVAFFFANQRSAPLLCLLALRVITYAACYWHTTQNLPLSLLANADMYDTQWSVTLTA